MNNVWTKPEIEIKLFSNETLITSSPAPLDQTKADIEGAEGKFKIDWLRVIE